MKTGHYLLSLVLLSLFGCNQPGPTDADVLWYNQPAANWEEALPLGNGKIGVMVFGHTQKERIQLNDDSMWPGDNGWEDPDGAPEDLATLRQMLIRGENLKADAFFVEKFSRKYIMRSHQTLGDLYIEFNHDSISDYRRELNISNATARVSYKTHGQVVTQETFVSNPHNLIVLKYTASGNEGLSGRITMNRPMDEGHPTVEVVTTEDGLLVMQGEVTQRAAHFNSQPDPILEGVEFETCLKVRNKGGEVLAGEDFLELKNVQEAEVYVISNSSFYFPAYQQENKKQLAALSGLSYKKIREAHINDYRALYDRLDFELHGADYDTIPTDKRIERIKQGEIDLGLEELLFQYGRYLLIASSREGTNPANLQGLWNQHISAPWNADYHLNINLQMNYWLADVTALGELNNPLFDYTDRLVASGQSTASKNFGCRGSFIPHATDLWAPTWLRATTAYWGCSVGAAGWMMQHYWQHFAFTKDTAFLRERVYPALHEVAAFYSDWIIEDPRDGTLVSAPSTSPENRYINAKGEAVATCMGSAMDQQIIAEVFDNYRKTCEILNIQDDLLTRINNQRLQLRDGFVIGSDGRILEWDREYQEHEPGHRHISHLYGFHPGTSISKDKTPEIFDAVKKTLDYRLAHGGAGTGWSRAWLINCSARLLDGDMAHEHIQFLFKQSIYNNLFDAHPPFQIDGNFGYTAGIAEMLIQSHEEGMVRVLPALPSAWTRGHVKGIKARGAMSADIYFTGNALEKVVFHSKYGNAFDMIYENETIPVNIPAGKSWEYKPKV